MRRKECQREENLQAKIDALKPYECDLNDKQHSELLRAVTAISKDSCAIEKLCSEAVEVLGGENNLLREAWRQDVTSVSSSKRISLQL